MKFRGKRKDNGEEVKGWYIEHPFSDDLTKFVSCIIQDERPYEVIPETVAMFTTLLDKNKKEIYGSIPIDGKMSRGGDIIEWEDSDDCVTRKFQEAVTYQQGAFQTLACQYGLCDFEVIGNQYDDKELLK